MEKIENLIFMTLAVSLSISYISFWIYMFKVKIPKVIKEKKTFILKEFNENKDIFISDLRKNNNFIVSKNLGWRIENDIFIKNDCFVKLTDLMNIDRYDLSFKEHRR